jgi:16S rRNA (uracil1498-N3)-methyltransferase
MTVHRFYALPGNINEDLIILSASDSHHLVNVMRLSDGDEIIVFDGRGKEYLCKVIEAKPEGVKACVLEQRSLDTELRTSITVVQAIPKSDKMDFIVQKCTELGVMRIVPVISDRTVVKLTPKKESSRRERWQRIACEAAKQCGRTVIPEISEVSPFRSALNGLESCELALIPWEGERTTRIGSVLKRAKARSVAVYIGPEGGFSVDEVKMAVQCGVIPVSLGPRILRTETAGIVASTIILYEYGEI